MMRLDTPIMLAARPTQPSAWASSVSSRSAATGRSSGVAGSDFRARNSTSLQISRTMSVLLVVVDGRRDGLGREAGPRFGGMYSVRGVELFGVGPFVKASACVCQQRPVLPGGLPVRPGQGPAHLVVVPALGGKSLAALP